MRVELGSRVYSADGKDLGVIRYLVLDPANNQVRSAVIEKGFFLTRDVELPIDSFVLGPEQQLQVSHLSDEVAAMPPFDLAKYTTPPGAAVPIGIAASGMLWPTSAAFPPTAGVGPATAPVAVGRDMDTDLSDADHERAEVAERLYRENAVISEGSDVISLDGKQVGEVERVDFDAASGRPISFVVRRGFLMKDQVALPGDVIASVDDRVIYLSINEAGIAQASQRIVPRAA